MGASIRFIHSADLHIDSLFKTKGYLPERLLERLQQSTFEAFDRLIDACIDHHVDFLLITGDLYNEEIRSIKAQVHLRDGFKRLQQKNIHVYVSYGNHDYLEGTKLPIAMPENVHIFESERVDYFSFQKNGEKLANIYGFSYESRVVRDRKALSFKKEGEGVFHIGMLHGSLETNTDHDVYAPFSLEELRSRKMDYWALGHIHKRSILSEDPPILYPGNIQGRSRKENGEKGCYLVENHAGMWDYQFIPLQSIVYDSVEVEYIETTQIDEVEKVLERSKEAVFSGSPVMLSIHMVIDEGLIGSQSAEVIKEWGRVINDQEDLESDQWVWIEDIQIEKRKMVKEEELLNSSHFSGELLRTMAELDDTELEEWLSPLFSHRKVSRHAPAMSPEQRKERLEEAKSWLLHQMRDSGGEEVL